MAEFVATHTVSKEIMWARNFMKSVGHEQKFATVLYEDNMSTISMIKNKSNGKQTKHVELRYTIIRDHVSKKLIAVEWMDTKNMTADILTKALAPSSFEYLRLKLLGMYVQRLVDNEVPSLKDVYLDSFFDICAGQ